MNSSRPRIVILGAGFGGLTLATELDHLAEQGLAEITLIERNSTFSMGFSIQWVLAGRRQPEEGERSIISGNFPHVRLVQADITAINTALNIVMTGSVSHPYDMLVVALGADLRSDLVPGMEEAAFNLCNLVSVMKMRDALQSFQGGTIAILVSSTPFKCPPMPYEYAFLIDEILQKQGVREQTRLVLATPEAQPMPIAGKAIGDKIKELLAERGIEFLPDHAPVSIDPAGRIINFQNGSGLNYTLLGAIPPHRAPRVVLESGLAGPNGFVPVLIESMQTSVADVFAVGDVASLTLPQGKPHPKAGVFAEAQAHVLASQIIARLTGDQGGVYSAAGDCHVDTGFNQAASTHSELLAENGPVVTMQAPSEDGLRAKQSFEQERMSKWFKVTSAAGRLS